MKQRVITAALLIPPVLLAVFVSHILPIYILALLAYVIGVFELRRMGATKWIGFIPLLLIAASPLLVVQEFYNGSPDGMPGNENAFKYLAIASLAMSIFGTIGAVTIARGRRGPGVVETAGFWLGGGLLALIALHGWSSDGHYIPVISLSFRWATPVLLALIPLWIGDSLAIFAGRAFGKHLLAPKISPKKTVEGGAANLLGCIAGGIGVAALIGQPLFVGLLAGLATGILGQAGDLLESAMKRSADLKDSGTLLPGHGGLLDRIDSILLSAPWVALIVVAAGYTQK